MNQLSGFSEDRLDAALAAFKGQMIGQKNDPPGTPVGPYLHGPTGLFNRRDIDNPIMSAFMYPQAGVAAELPVFNEARSMGGVFGGEDQIFDTIITGVTAGAADDFSNQPTAACDNGPVAGLRKLCSVVNTNGNYKYSTREVEIHRAGRVQDRVDANSRTLMNSPVMQAVIGVPNDTPSLQNAIGNEFSGRVWEMSFGIARSFFPRTYIGSPANNNGEAKDIVGLDIHINANNKRDASGSHVCTAANSLLLQFGYDLVGGTGRDIVQYLEWAMHYLADKARRQGLAPTTWALAMRPDLFFALSEVWPVRQYQAALTQISNFTNGRVVIDATNAQEMRDRFRSQMILPINGRLVRVIEDDTIAEDNPNTTASLQPGQWASDIYIIPLTGLGGIPLTFWEYFDHSNQQSAMIERMAGGNVTFTSDGGMFRWDISYNNGCLKANVRFAPRLRMKATQLAARIQDVAYQNLGHTDDWQTDSDYFFNGGRTEGDNTTYYTPWSSTPVSVG